MHLTLQITLIICCFSQIFSIPVPIENEACPPCEWTEWFNVDHPKEDSDGGDWETLANITARGFDVCQVPRDITCRSAQFPSVFFEHLKYQCEWSTGLICLNKNNEARCVDFEVQFLCCLCDQVPDSSKRTTTEMPTSPEQSTSQVPALPTVSPTTCYNAQCTWTDWFNMHHPTPGRDGGDFENVTAIINQGYSICAAPQAAECRLVRFPYIPLRELYFAQECGAQRGLVCLNKNQEQGECLDYEARFLCCSCDNYLTKPDTDELLHRSTTNDDITDGGSGMSSGQTWLQT